MTASILALETTGSIAAAAFFRDGALQGEQTVWAERSHGRDLLPLVRSLLVACGAARADVVAASAGPGSFTGIRVGMSAARGLALGWGARLLAVPTFEAWAEAVPLAPGETTVAIRDAGRGAVFVQSFGPAASDPPSRASLPAVLASRVGRSTLFVGDGGEDFRRSFEGRPEWRFVLGVSAASIGRWALAHREDGHDVGFHPIYLRPSQAERQGGST